MKNKEKTPLATGVFLTGIFILWTALIKTIEVRPVGPDGSYVGFATLNCRVHQLTGVHMTLYTVTDWLGLMPVAVCMIFAGIGMVQLIRRRSLKKVDRDIVFLGVYYIVVIAGYLLFEMYPVNYRPVLINGMLEASYPSSTTLLVVSVMPTFVFQVGRRAKRKASKWLVAAAAGSFMAFMVAARMISGVHWCTDIIGGLLLSAGLFYLYKASVLMCDKRINQR